jgi:hypothetical protein
VLYPAVLLGILEFRQRLGLQTVAMTATIPESAAKLIADRMKMKLIVAGDDETRPALFQSPSAAQSELPSLAAPTRCPGFSPS